MSDGTFGWVSTLKDTFGFIEAFNHSSEIFFHFSELLAPLETYKIGTPVSFVMGIKGKTPFTTQLLFVLTTQSIR